MLFRSIRELSGPNAQGWAIIKDGESIITKLEPLVPTVLPTGIFPWRPSHGFEIKYEWVVDSAQKHLLWLPHHWRMVEHYEPVWNGQFLALPNQNLSRTVILEFY